MPPEIRRWRAGAQPRRIDLQDAETGAPPRCATVVTLGADDCALAVRFDCVDPDPWSRFRRRDEPLWQEEVVEVFLAPGTNTPRRYVELEVSPAGVLFDAVIDNPTGLRRDLVADTSWDGPGLGWAAGLAPGGWWATFEIPWATVLAALGHEGPNPQDWRANFYRIDRPRDGSPAEFSAAAPTLVTPADFHRPECFGYLVRV